MSLPSRRVARARSRVVPSMGSGCSCCRRAATLSRPALPYGQIMNAASSAGVLSNHTRHPRPNQLISDLSVFTTLANRSEPEFCELQRQPRSSARNSVAHIHYSGAACRTAQLPARRRVLPSRRASQAYLQQQAPARGDAARRQRSVAARTPRREIGGRTPPPRARRAPWAARASSIN